MRKLCPSFCDLYFGHTRASLSKHQIPYADKGNFAWVILLIQNGGKFNVVKLSRMSMRWFRVIANQHQRINTGDMIPTNKIYSPWIIFYDLMTDHLLFLCCLQEKEQFSWKHQDFSRFQLKPSKKFHAKVQTISFFLMLSWEYEKAADHSE